MRLILLIILLFSSLQAGDKSKVVILPSSEVIDGDYFAWGATVEISGTIKRDLYVVGGQVVVDGTIEGDILAAGGSLLIAGEVKGNIRVIGGQVAVRGSIRKNCTIVAGSVEFLPSATIGEGIVGIFGSVDLSAPVGKDVVLAAGSARISSTIGCDVEAYVGQLRIANRAVIGGDVNYSSSSEATVDPLAKIGGHIQRHATVVQNLAPGKWFEKFLLGTKVIGLLMNFIYSFVIGWFLIKLFPETVEGSLAVLRTRPAKALGYGFLALILLPLTFLILLITVFGIPFALMLLALNIAAFYSAKIISVLAASNKLLKRFGMKPYHLSTLAIGLAVYFLVTAIPFVGSVIAFAALLFGMGATILTAKPFKRR